MIPIGILGGDKTLARKRDVAKAKQLLTEAGYPNGVDLKLTYWTAPLLGVPSEPLAAKLQADLAQAGIKVTLRREGALGRHRRVPSRKDPADAGLVVSGLPRS